MCFSASASFGASVLLSFIGVASLKKVQSPNQFPFASIPLIFAVQQAFEGFVWLSFSNPAFEEYGSGSSYIFLLFAQVVWPVWVPYSILILSPKEQRTWLQKGFLLAGTVVSVYLGYCLLNFPVKVYILGYHIAYDQSFPAKPALFIGALYLLATIAPILFSRLSRMWVLGILILISYLVTALLYSDYIISVWCFFAAIIGVVILAIVAKFKSLPQEKPDIMLPVN
ncbi:MAG: DUF6629 family protein [Bacteroidia bacterium]